MNNRALQFPKPKPLYTTIITSNNIINNIKIININNRMKIKFIGKAKVTKQGQVTLPNEARQDLGIELNSEVYWYEIDNMLIAVKNLVNQKELQDLIKKKVK